MKIKTNLCKCGCGNLCEQNYLKGHGRKGKKNSVEHNMKIGSKNKGKMKFNEFINSFQYTNDGIGKNTLINDVDKNELLVGIGVEMEHTNDLNQSASIAIDHLTENNKYYSILIKSGLVDEKKALELGDKFLNIVNDMPEDSVQQNTIGNTQGEDTEMTDILLGYEPHNVGDEIEAGEEIDLTNPDKDMGSPAEFAKKMVKVQEEIGMVDYKGNIGDRYSDAEGNEFAVNNKVKGGVTLKGQSGDKEIATNDLQFMKKLGESTEADDRVMKRKDPATWNQIQIARKTLKMPDAMAGVMGGMTKKEAAKILMLHNAYQDSRGYDYDNIK